MCIGTNPDGFTKPNAPDFNWELLKSDNDKIQLKITWLSNVQGIPGSDFFVKYRVKGEMENIILGVSGMSLILVLMIGAVKFALRYFIMMDQN